MKKIMALLLSAILVLGMSVTALAAPSPTADYNYSNVTATSDWGKVVVSASYKTEEEKAAAEELAADPLKMLGDVVGESAAKDMQLSALFDVRIEGTVSMTHPVTITFNVPGVTTKSTVYVLHYVDGAWQQEDHSLGNSTVTVTFHSLSPVAIYVDKETASNGAGTTPGGDTTVTTPDSSTPGTTTPGDSTTPGTNGGTSDTVTSPQTGEAPVAVFTGIIACAAVAGMTVSVRRRRA